jgi:predicted MFS family arabinose efflux permease
MDKKNDDFFSGIGLGASLIITGIALPFLFPSKIVMTITVFLIAFGIAGLGIELEKLYQNSGYTNLFMGIGFLLIGISPLILFFNTPTKILFLIMLLISFYAIVSGGLKLWHFNKQKTISQDQEKNGTGNLKLVLNFVLALSGFIANIVTILSFFNN